MSDAAHAHADDHEENHEGPIRTPKQLIVAVIFSFVVPIATIVLLASYVTTNTKPGAGTELRDEKSVAERIAPVGRVEVKDVSDPAALKPGPEVYAAQCASCHAAAVAGAPKFGDAAAWEARIKTGYEALLTAALKGKGAMGAQGGGDFTDVEIGRAVVHMANAAGAKFEEPKVAAAASAPAEGAAPAVAAAPVEQTPAAKAGAAAPAPTAAPAPAGAASPPATAAAPAAPPAPVAAAKGEETKTAAAGAAPALYTQICQACHIAGLAGAPKFGDKAAWAPRVAQGVDALTKTVITGKGAMPPKGGAAAASEADIKAAVAYMVDAAK